MDRAYDTGKAKDITFFIGVEVEKTPAYGKKTLFVTGVQPYNDIMNYYIDNKCEHIFFGANHSYNPTTADEYEDWDLMIQAFLDKKIWCSLDIPTTVNLEWVLEGGLNENNFFIPQIRVSVPYVKLWNYNAMIKIDDKGFDESNPGVWCHELHTLMDKNKFTHWDQYNLDKILK